MNIKKYVSENSDLLDFDNLGVGAQKEVKKAIERFKKLPESEKEKIPLLYWLLGDEIPPYKMSKERAKYRKATSQELTCKECIHSWKPLLNINNESLCSYVRGSIDTSSTCNMWCGPSFDFIDDEDT